MAANLTENIAAKPPIVADLPKVDTPTIVAREVFVEPVAFRRIYVWELPVRAYHLVNGLCIVVLAATGFMIGNPQAIFNASEAYQQYWFGWIRFTHFAAAYIFTFNLLFRLYWSFVGNEYSRWYNYVPYRKEQLKNIWEVLTTDVLQFRMHRKLFIGHNYMASFSYFVMFILSLLMIFTGFALYSSTSSFFLPKLFTWITPLFGSEAVVRQWHHLFMWGFIAFTIIHVYLVFYHDVFEGRGTTSSIIGGWTYMKDDEIKNR